MNRRLVVSVIGDARLDNPAREAEARALGAGLMGAGFRLVTGGLDGVMGAVCRGARESPAWTEGSTVGIVPSYDAAEANQWCDFVVPTGLQYARNVLVVACADVVVACGGGAGTLSEMALAWQLGKPIIAFGDTGWAGRLAGSRLDHRPGREVVARTSAADVVAACRDLCGTAGPSGRIGGGARRGDD